MRLILVLLLSILPAVASAEVLQVRSGEHSGFSRLVIELDGPTPWRLGRTERGYALILTRRGISYDLSRVYRLIPRDRIAAVRDAGAGRLDLTVDCDCHAEAFQFGPRKLVVDVISGPAAENSPFERPLARPGASAKTLPLPKPEPAPAPERAAPETAVAETAVAEAGVATAKPAEAMAGMTGKTRNEPLPPVYDWRRGLPDIPGRDAPADDPQAASPDGGGRGDATPHQAPDHGTATVEARPQDHATPGSGHQSDGTAAPSALERHLGGAEQKLAEAIGRAASGGLLTLDPANLPRPPPEEKGTAHRPAAPPPPRDAPEGPRMETKTSLDPRLTGVDPVPVTETGGPCLPDALFNVNDWGDDSSPTAQIEALRRTLVGEFDRPDPASVGALMRLYIYLGFGAEALVLPKSLRIELPDGDVLRAMAEIVDRGSATDPGRLAGQADCDGKVALWSVLATPQLSPSQHVEAGAVVRSFSALPLHLRRMLGPVLADRLLAQGNVEAARAIRDAVTRAPGDVGASVALTNARLDLARGEADRAIASLKRLAASDGLQAAEALIVLVDAEVARRGTILDADRERLAALAHEHRGSPLGRRLARAHLLALGLEGKFAEAFRDLAKLAPAAPGATADHSAPSAEAANHSGGHDMATADASQPDGNGSRALWSLLADRGADDVMLRLAIVPPAEGGVQRRDAVKIAHRLLDLGFPDATLNWLRGLSPPEPEERRLAARAQLALGNAKAARDTLEGLSGPEADLLRAEALAKTGAHADAAAAFGSVGAVAQEGAQAWRAGDWDLVRRSGSADQKAALALVPGAPSPSETSGGQADMARRAEIDPAAGSGPEPPQAAGQGGAAEGELAQGRELVSGSAAMRAALEKLLSGEKVPPEVPGPALAPAAGAAVRP